MRNYSAGKEAAAQVQTVSAATQEQSASMEEIASSSQALAKMAEELTQAVNRFKEPNITHKKKRPRVLVLQEFGASLAVSRGRFLLATFLPLLLSG